MADPASDALAQKRWMAITVLRLVGVLMVVAGILAVNGAIALPVEAGYVLIALGVLDTFLVPQFLARRWRSPKGE